MLSKVGHGRRSSDVIFKGLDQRLVAQRVDARGMIAGPGPAGGDIAPLRGRSGCSLVQLPRLDRLERFGEHVLGHG